MPNSLSVCFPVNEHSWTYDAVTNKIWRNKSSGISPDVSERAQANSCGANFRVKKLVYRVTESEYLNELETCMTHLMLELTQACTLRCSYCIYSGNYEGERTHSEKHMEYQTAMDAITFFERHSRNTQEPVISFYGGEALLQFDMIRRLVDESVGLFDGRRIMFRIATNGTTLSNDVCQWLCEHPYVFLDLTLNGNVHDRYRRFANGGGSLAVIERNLSLLRDHYPTVFNKQLHFLCNYADAVELKEILRYYQEHGLVPSLVTGISREGGNEIIQTLGVTEEKNSRALDELRQSYCEHPTPYSRAVFDSSMLLIHSRSASILREIAGMENCCFPFMTNCYVDASGQITLCEKMPGTERFGNIYSGINMSKLMRLMQNYVELRNAFCLNCWAQRLCTRCFASIHEASRFSEPCDGIRQRILDDLTLYCHIYENAPKLFASFSDIVFQTQERR